MGAVARYGRAVAKDGSADELGTRLLAAARELEDDPGCLVYVVNRQADRREVFWVTEIWRSQADLDASIERIRGSDDVAAVLGLVEEFSTVELDVLGGKGPVAGA